MMINNMISSAKYYWYAEANRKISNKDTYYREVTKRDKVDFSEAKLKGYTSKDGQIIPDRSVYYNPNTKEVTHAHPRECMTFEYGRDNLNVLTILQATSAGFVSAGFFILLGYPIVSLGKGALIGSAIGAIKAYVDSVHWKETPMWVTTRPSVIDRVRQLNGERFPERDPNVEHTS